VIGFKNAKMKYLKGMLKKYLFPATKNKLTVIKKQPTVSWLLSALDFKIIPG
jgi:hypothetical protein